MRRRCIGRAASWIREVWPRGRRTHQSSLSLSSTQCLSRLRSKRS
jgi:hypothetical protein